MLERSWRRRRWPYPICLLPVQPWCPDDLRIRLEFSDDRMIFFRRSLFTDGFLKRTNWTCPVLTGKLLWRWYWYCICSRSQWLVPLHERRDRSQAVNINHGNRCSQGSQDNLFCDSFVYVGSLEPCNSSPPSQKKSSERRDFPAPGWHHVFQFFVHVWFSFKGNVSQKKLQSPPKTMLQINHVQKNAQLWQAGI